MEMNTIHHGDCREILAAMEPDSIDAIVTDPPYGLEFMGKEWDRLDIRQIGDPTFQENKNYPGRVRHSSAASYGGNAGKGMQDWHEAWAREAYRILKPGGHLLAFGGTRTEHRLTCAIEDAGFEIRDTLSWMYGSGFPKSLDAERAIAVKTCTLPGRHFANMLPAEDKQQPNDHVCPMTSESEPYDGFGTALKPAWEPIIMARKPLTGTVAQTVLTHGTGALNIDASRIGTNGGTTRGENGSNAGKPRNTLHGGNFGVESINAGRWPPNVLLSHHPSCQRTGTRRVKSHNPDNKTLDSANTFDGGWAKRSLIGHADADGMETVDAYRCHEDCPVRLLDAQSGERGGGRASGPDHRPSQSKNGYGPGDEDGWSGNWHRSGAHYGDTGGASRFMAVMPPDPESDGRGRDGEASADRRYTERGGTNFAPLPGARRHDQGGPSRFMAVMPVDDPDEVRFKYCPKASRAERNAGLDGMPERESRPLGMSNWKGQTNGSGETMGPSAPQSNGHPTVKPIALMRWLVRLVTPPGGTVLDPFMGSGSTGCAAALEGFDFVGIEQEAEYVEIAERRIAHWNRVAMEGEAPKQKQRKQKQPKTSASLTQLSLIGDD